jgi:hypothetical protein
VEQRHHARTRSVHATSHPSLSVIKQRRRCPNKSLFLPIRQRAATEAAILSKTVRYRASAVKNQ